VFECGVWAMQGWGWDMLQGGWDVLQ
jgi:hypothetical protein